LTYVSFRSIKYLRILPSLNYDMIVIQNKQEVYHE